MTGIESTHAFRRSVLATAPRVRRTERIAPFSILLGIIGLIFAAIAYLMLVTIDQAATPEKRMEQFWVSLLAIVGAVFFFASIAYGVWMLSRKWRRRRAAADLALSRGWHYNFAWDPSDFAGTLFRTGRQAWVENGAHVHEPRYIEAGNYSYMATEGPRGRREIGFVGIQLDRTLPHMYLASTTNAGTRAYTPPFASDQRLSLEGDFDRWFRLYCPGEYEQDALYIITPDVMALMIDEAPGFDIEIVDDWMFIVARRPFDMTDGRVLDFAYRVGSTLGQRTARQSAQYRDERHEDAAFIDDSGARLKTGRWVATVVPAVVVGLVWFGIAWASGVVTL
ncbi:hypothetical protein [Microbacterium sp.]|uniref:hypothetical protein n=1 Tax=Microbacterium sp. TaxID=51671 RepID=UPI002606FD60|nr:hypothetical protein [Microbacterium sp.]